MAIPVITRAGKGAALTHNEGDTNWTNLARSATAAIEGNIKIANSTEAADVNENTTAISPFSFIYALQGQMTDRGYSFGKKGHVHIPVGVGQPDLLIQWGSEKWIPSGNPEDSTNTYSFDIPFPNNVFFVLSGMHGYNTVSPPVVGLPWTVETWTWTLSTVTVATYLPNDDYDIGWIAIGN